MRGLFLLTSKNSFMNRLTKNEITALAELPIQDPQLNAFRTRLLIAYTAGLDYIMGSVLDKECIRKGYSGQEEIENGWLVIDEVTDDGVISFQRARPRFIPLHPIVRKIFAKHNNNIPRFHAANMKKFRQLLAAALSHEMLPKVCEQEWDRRLVYTFRSYKSVLLDMWDQGLSKRECLLLTGLNSSRFSFPVISQRVEDLFMDPFFGYLKPLAKQQGIDSAEIRGVKTLGIK
jgi:hypothetical protein